MAPPTTRHLTILLTDIKGFTDKTSQRSRADIQRLLDDHRDVVLPVLQSRGGRLIKTIGDAFLMAFESPTDAVLAGVAAQEALAKRNAGVADDDRIEIRIAINAGEVNLVEGDVYGEPVNIAARIEGVTEAGEVYFTEAVYLAMNKTEVPSSEIGLLQLKGIPEKVRVYKVRRETPLGVGQVPAARAPRGAGDFAPGEKARLAAPAAAPAVSYVSGARPSLARRAGAVLIDACLCGFIISAFWPGTRTEVHVRRDAHRGAASAGGAPARVSIDDKGVRVPGLAITDEGIKVGAPAKDGAKAAKKNVKIDIGLTGVEVDDGSEAKEEKVYDEDGWSVSTVKKRKDLRFPIVWLVYSLVFIRRLGTTPGGKICKLAVIPHAGSGPVDKRQNLMRAFFSLISGYCAGLGYLWALWEKDGRGWHDLMAGTRVVAAE